MARFADALVKAPPSARTGARICNGFQILLEAGLLPGAMLRNKGLQHREHVHLWVKQMTRLLGAAGRAGADDSD
jgi:phosphoribosylformylglycinamidine synthase